MIIKRPGEEHFTLQFGDGSCSHRIILAQADHCEVKVTKFHPVAGFGDPKIHYPTNETVIIIEGEYELTFDGETHTLGPGTVYHASAGEFYMLKATKPGLAYCVFSRAANGPYPEDGPFPKKDE